MTALLLSHSYNKYNEKNQPIKKVKPIGFGEYKNKVS